MLGVYIDAEPRRPIIGKPKTISFAPVNLCIYILVTATINSGQLVKEILISSSKVFVLELDK